MQGNSQLKENNDENNFTIWMIGTISIERLIDSYRSLHGKSTIGIPTHLWDKSDTEILLQETDRNIDLINN